MKQQDDIEKFIRGHRDAFDDAVPNVNLWDRIEKELPAAGPSLRPKRRGVLRSISRSGKRWMSAAAVLFLGIFLAAFIRAYQVKTHMADNAIPSDLRDAQTYYENKIDSKIREIKSLSHRTNNSDTSLLHLFGERDEEYDRIRKDLHNNPDNPHVRSAFVEYYRSRLGVLDRIEQHLQNK